MTDRLVTLDRQNKTWSLLVVGGDLYDIYGESWAEMKTEALALADHLGITIDVFNSELPEK